MAKRSPILGYNHNIGYRGLVFHVQTEDSGVDNPHIFTHLFYGGVILSSRKLDYDAEADDSVVKSLMQAQHKAVLKDLRRGSFDEKIDSYLGAHPELEPSGKGAPPADTLAEPAAAAPAPAVPDALPVAAPGPGAATPAAAAPEATTEETTDPELRASTIDDDPELELELVPELEPELLSEIEPELIAEIEPPVAKAAPAAAHFGPRRGSPIPPAPPPIKSKPAHRPPPRVGRNDTVEIHSPAPPREMPGDGAEASRGKPPPVPGDGRPQEPMARAHGGNVLVSRPPIVVDPRKPAPGAAPAARAEHMATPPRTAREENQDSLFDQSLISERSLDDVILAYLSEDATGED